MSSSDSDLGGPGELGCVIVHYFREEETLALVRQLLDAEVEGRNIVVADNGSSGSPFGRQLTAIDQDLVHLLLPNVGYGAAVNAAVRELAPEMEFICVFTHEVHLDPGCLTTLRATFESRPDAGLVAPMLCTPDGAVWSTGGEISPLRRMPFNMDKGQALPRRRRVMERSWVDGAAFMIRRSDLLRVGGVSEKFFLYFEDVDLGLRLSQIDRKVLCNTAAVAVQSPGGHLDQYLAIRNLLWLLRDHGYWSAWAAFLFENLVRLAIGPILRPQGASLRLKRRARGIRHGLGRSKSQSVRSQHDR